MKQLQLISSLLAGQLMKNIITKHQYQTTSTDLFAFGCASFTFHRKYWMNDLHVGGSIDSMCVPPTLSKISRVSTWRRRTSAQLEERIPFKLD